jgi:hypothetical protein
MLFWSHWLPLEKGLSLSRLRRIQRAEVSKDLRKPLASCFGLYAVDAGASFQVLCKRFELALPAHKLSANKEAANAKSHRKRHATAVNQVNELTEKPIDMGLGLPRAMGATVRCPLLLTHMSVSVA